MSVTSHARLPSVRPPRPPPGLFPSTSAPFDSLLLSPVSSSTVVPTTPTVGRWTRRRVDLSRETPEGRRTRYRGAEQGLLSSVDRTRHLQDEHLSFTRPVRRREVRVSWNVRRGIVPVTDTSPVGETLVLQETRFSSLPESDLGFRVTYETSGVHTTAGMK